MTLGEPIHGASGQILLRRGVTLNARFITLLRNMGIPAAYIQDPDTADIEIPYAVKPETRAKVIANLTTVFQAISRQSNSFAQSARDIAQQDMRAERFARPMHAIANNAGLSELFVDVDALIEQALSNEVIAGLNSIKTHDQYTFQHSIDVTIMGLVLARRAGWDKQRLKAFGMGCILHDIGKIFIEPAILNKTGPLTAEEYRTVKGHPIVGRELIRAIAPGLGYLVLQVAYQHHEREDGSGYPRGLRGNNTLSAHPGGLIHEFGALSAVADVYDALTSRRSYRTGWTTDCAASHIISMAGTQFNRQAVEYFSAAVAPYPVCSDVRVVTGRYAGYVGVVSAVKNHDMQRPTVRLLFNAYGRRINPMEIDLSVDRDISIAAINTSELAKLAGKAA
jgi:HD-GYP domain-containing protein (c-di-GMP phosphodiesterase class II)